MLSGISLRMVAAGSLVSLLLFGGCGKALLVSPEILNHDKPIQQSGVYQQTVRLKYDREVLEGSVSQSIVESMSRFFFNNPVKVRDIDVQLRSVAPPITEIQVFPDYQLVIRLELPVSILLTLSKGNYADKKMPNGMLLLEILVRIVPDDESRYRFDAAVVFADLNTYGSGRIGPYKINYRSIVNDESFHLMIKKELEENLGRMIDVRRDIAELTSTQLSNDEQNASVILNPKSFVVESLRDENSFITVNLKIQSRYLFAKGSKVTSFSTSEPPVTSTSKEVKPSAFPSFSSVRTDSLRKIILRQLRAGKCCSTSRVEFLDVQPFSYDSAFALSLQIVTSKAKGLIVVYGSLEERDGQLRFANLMLHPKSTSEIIEKARWQASSEMMEYIKSRISIPIPSDQFDQTLDKRVNVSFTKTKGSSNETSIVFDGSFGEIVIYNRGLLEIDYRVN